MKREYFSTSSHLSKVTLLAGIFLSQVTPSFASPFIKTYPEPPLVQEGLKFDINQDGQVDFKIDELKHSQPDIQVTSFRMVGLTHIHYRDDPAETPILLHARYQGIFDAPATLPGTEPKHFLFHPNELVFGEFARAESDLIGAKTIRGNFSPSGRTYVGLSVDTLSGGYWGWAEISLIGPLHFGEKTTPEEIKVSITATVKGFMEAKSPEEASHFVLGGVKKIPLMKEFASRVGEVSPAGFGELIELKAGAFGGVPIQVAVVSEADGKSAWRFLLVPMSDRYLIDWEASVAYGEMSWKAFLRERPTGQTCLRVYLHRDHHQPGLPTEAENDFYRVQARVEKWALVSFVGKDSPIAEELKKIVPPSSSQPVRIVMKWDEDKLTSEIVGIRHNYWINLSEYRAELLRDGKSP
ncbi:hypothetical protein N9213_03010 [Akkermansiaceae bacterium]|nr:hypothetical protein [Akkermansiaceae bacterium]